jgi:hypothetical protein
MLNLFTIAGPGYYLLCVSEVLLTDLSLPALSIVLLDCIFRFITRRQIELTNSYAAEIADVTVHFVIEDGCLLQQYILTSLSDESDVDLVFTVNLDIGLWPTAFWEQPYDVYKIDHIALELDSTGLSAQRKGEPLPENAKFPNIGPLALKFALFENGNAVELHNTSSRRNRRTVRLVKNERRELTAKYHFGALNSTIRQEPELDIQSYVSVSDFLRKERHGIWELHRPKDSTFIFRRYLEHILSVCAIPVQWEDGNATAIAFSDGEMLEPFIGAANLLVDSPPVADWRGNDF